MYSSRRTKSRNETAAESGTVYVLLALFLFPLMALLALAVDGSALMFGNIQQFNNAEYAAMAALRVALRPDGTTDAALEDAAINQAATVAGANRLFTKSSVKQVDSAADLGNGTLGNAGSVTFGHWDATARKFISGPGCGVPSSPGKNAVRVELQTNQPSGSRGITPLFSQILGYSTLDTRSVGIATWDPLNGTVRLVKELSLPQGRSPMDVNGDGVINASDAQIVNDYLIAGGGGNLCFDVNEDGSVSASDSLRISDYINAGGS